jgi:hypothetical protein
MPDVGAVPAVRFSPGPIYREPKNQYQIKLNELKERFDEIKEHHNRDIRDMRYRVASVKSSLIDLRTAQRKPTLFLYFVRERKL